jgi:membrane-associated protease RseP (regulator of RpoE activity)
MGTELILMGFLGLLLMIIVRQNISRITRTPWWLLWLVLMIPPLFITYWRVNLGQQKIPFSLALIVLFFSTLLYIFLVWLGKIQPSASATKAEVTPEAEAGTASNLAPAPPAPEVRMLDREEESQLQGCFPWSIFYLQQVEMRPQAAICRGQLRAQPETAYRTVQDNISAQFGDRYLLIFQVGASEKPFFALVPNPQAQTQPSTVELVGNSQATSQASPQARLANANATPITRPVLALGLMLATLLTTTLIGVEIAGGQATFADLLKQPQLLLPGLPYALGLMGILGVHELGHYVTAKFYQLRATLPYFIPIPFALGTFGAFIQMRSPMPNRRVLFDVGIAGPLAGLVATIPILLWGLSQSSAFLPEAAGQPVQNVSAFDPRAFDPKISILLMLMSKLVLGAQLTAASRINLDPLAIAGCLGLVVTALNLMPMGQLDGGHIVHAMFGQRNGAAIGQVTRILVLFLALLIQPWLRIWAILLFFMPAFDEPALNDVTELDNRRDFLGLAALLLLLLIILPAPEVFTNLILSPGAAPR